MAGVPRNTYVKYPLAVDFYRKIWYNVLLALTLSTRGRSKSHDGEQAPESESCVKQRTCSRAGATAGTQGRAPFNRPRLWERDNE